MSYKLFSFVEIKSLISTTPGVVSDVGELSPYCRTFTPDVRVTSRSIINSYDFGSEGLDTSPIISAGNTAYNKLSIMLNGCIGLGIGNVGPIVDRIQTLFDNNPISGDDHTYDVIEAGQTVTDSLLYYPSYFKVNVTNASAVVFEIYVWLVDSNFNTTTVDNFRDQFPLATFNVVPPLLTSLDGSPVTNCLDFILNFSMARSTITSRTVQANIDRAQTFLIGKVVTGFEYITLRVYNYNNHAQFFDCPLVVGYNGQKGVTYNNNLNAFLNYLLSLGGGFTPEDWLNVIPQLEATGTYYVIPQWDKVAVPNAAPLGAPVWYNSSIKAVRIPLLANACLSEMFTSEQIDSITEATVIEYKNIAVVVVPDTANNGGHALSLGDNYTDFTSLALSELPLSQPSLAIQDGISDIIAVLAHAETYVNGVSVLPSQLYVEEIDGKKWLSLVDASNSIKVYVLTKESFPSGV